MSEYNKYFKKQKYTVRNTNNTSVAENSVENLSNFLSCTGPYLFTLFFWNVKWFLLPK